MPGEQAHQGAWRRVRDRLRLEVAKHKYKGFLQPLELQQRNVVVGLRATIIAPNHAVQHWATTHFANRLLALWRIEDERLTRLTITGLDGEFGEQMPNDPVPASNGL